MRNLTIEDFEACKGDVFKVYYGEEEPFEFTLATVSPLGRAPDPDEARRQSFSLLFQHPLIDNYLMQNSFEVEHPVLGKLFMFLVPLGPGNHGMEYEAVFT